MSKPDSNGGGMFGRVIMPPVQSREARTEGAAVSFRLPLLQALALAASATILTCLVGLAVRNVGELAFWTPVFVVASTTFVWKLWRESRDHDATWLGLAGAVVFALLAGLVGLAAYKVAVLMAPQWWVAVLVVFFAYLTPLLALPFLQELAYRSPFIEKAIGDIATGIALARYAVPQEPEEPEPQTIRQVPVYVQGNAQQIIDIDDEQDEADVLVAVPDAGTVRRLDLLQYIEQSGIIGTSFDNWHTSRGWQYPYWRAVVTELSRFGIVNEPRPRVATRLLVEPGEAIERLREK
jgi:hypothetical protein